MSFEFDPKKAALLVMDYQTAILANFPNGSDATIKNVSKALEASRAAGMRIIYVVVGFRAGYPEVSPNNKSFRALHESGRFSAGSAGTEIHPSLAPQASDLVVIKHRVSAFSGSDLEMLLRAGGIETMVLAGISSSGVVLSTIRQAADLDFRLLVLKDACLDGDAEVHSCLMEKIFPRQAEVQEVAKFIADLGGK